MDESRPETRKLIRGQENGRVWEKREQILEWGPRLEIIPCVKIWGRANNF